ncbi:hypothetical protein EJ05DRAFT_489245 [Pseudovirgaria hyperparasitica]|uniref:Uncharacterized protein n=1 Tax=Pseudovirgaria hyperparasitica TaxID=470096 RepID=A0A6A6VV36_9PEZI|nr:uncharacterized protein EJ05DRAFT_489245 [Pseudovirgaria hyperparasitica]KAF2754548.1 hypothetical protein EJ05DRAFT_489245 [Pseudovirgaria hyperparasitica]
MYQQQGHRPGGFPYKKKNNPVVTRYPPPPGYQPGYQQTGYQPQWPQGQQAPAPSTQQAYSYPNQVHQSPQHQSQGYSQQSPYGTYPQAAPQHYTHPSNHSGYYQPPPHNQYTPQVVQQQQQQPVHPQQYQHQHQHQPALQHNSSSSYTGNSPQSTFYPTYSSHVSASPQSAHSAQGSSSFTHHKGMQNGHPYGQTYPPQTHIQSHHSRASQPPGPQYPQSQGYDWLGGVYADDMGTDAIIPHVDEAPPPRKLPKEGPCIFAPEDEHVFWDFENSVGAFWPKAGDYVNPRTSIGVQVWRSAQRLTRPLPSLWKEAEEQAQAPPKEPLNYGNSVSEYHTAENAHESQLDVRQTDFWEEVKHFSEFKELQIPRTSNPRTISKDEWSIMDSLDQALNTSINSQPPTSLSLQGGEKQKTFGFSVDSNHRTSSQSSSNGKRRSPGQDYRQTKPPTDLTQNAELDAAQEEILARLGVSGPAKPSVWTPADVVPGSIPGAPPPPPPPPPPEPQMRRSPSIDPWAENRDRRSPSRQSSGSHKTIAGSDFDPDGHDSRVLNEESIKTEDVTHKTETSLLRKRSRGNDLSLYAASDLGRNQEDDGGRQADDGGKKKRPKLNGRISSVYG